MTVVFAVGQRVAERLGPLTRGRLVGATMVVGLVVAGCASAYALITGRSPFDVASSGTATLATITGDPAAWSSGALIALLVFKALGYMLSLGAFRGGPIFPSILLGGAFGVLLAPLPGLGVAGGLAVGMAAFAAAGMRMPLSAVALTCLMFGTNATGVFPEVALAAVVAYAARAALDKRAAAANAAPGPATA
jgi:H+/Cl- antiporter ClcA